MRSTAGALILILLSLPVNLISAEKEGPRVQARDSAMRGGPQRADSRWNAGDDQPGVDGTGAPEKREPPWKGSNQEKAVPQTQVGGGAFVVLDGYYVSVREQTYGAPGPGHHFLSSLDEPIRESWRNSILSEVRRHGPDARQEYILFSTGRP